MQPSFRGSIFISIISSTVLSWLPLLCDLTEARAADKYSPIANPTEILADWPDSKVDWKKYVEPIKASDYKRFSGPPLVNEPHGDLHVRAWKYVPDAGGKGTAGIVESRNVLKSGQTALILVHPWGIEDGQGWKNPQAYDCYGYAFMGSHSDNLLCLDHLKDVVRPFVQSLRGRLPVVAYSLPGSPDAVRGKIYRDYANQPDPAQRMQGQKELEAHLNSLSGKQWPQYIPVSKNLDYQPSDVIIYDGLGYAALKKYLQEKGIKNILLGGYCTDMCVISTTAGYKNLTQDFNVFLVGNVTLAAWPTTVNTPNGYKPHATRDELVTASEYSGKYPLAITQSSWISFSDAAVGPTVPSQPLPNTKSLLHVADTKTIVREQLQQVIGYFSGRVAATQAIRDEKWKADFSALRAYEQSMVSHRANCRKMLGLPDERADAKQATSRILAKTNDLAIERITVPIAEGLASRGLLFAPKGKGRHPAIIVCSDATCCPEQLAGLTADAKPPQWLKEMLSRGVMVYVVQSVQRTIDHPQCKKLYPRNRRQILYRLGYIVGRSLPGLDVQDTLSGIDYLASRGDVDDKRIGLVGAGQGGMTALYAAAVDTRPAAVAVGDYFDRREGCWAEPADRRLFGVLLEFGDAELAGLIAPRPLAIVRSSDSALDIESVKSEAARAARFYKGLGAERELSVYANCAKKEDALSRSILHTAERLGAGPSSINASHATDLPAKVSRKEADAVRNEHFEERIRYLRNMVDGSEAAREKRWGLTTRPPVEFPRIKAAMLEDYGNLVGKVDISATPPNPRTKLALITDKYKLYHVMLDVTEGVELYGHLLVPRNIKGRTAAVICQHGLDGTPGNISGLGEKGDTCYHQCGRRLAEHGYVVFAPLILHHYPVSQVDEQVRKASSAGMMRLAMVVAKTNRAIDFLQTLPFVDAKHIGYYGLSYGGYSAIWCAPLVDRLAATIASGNFNDRREKLTSDSTGTSYFVLPYEDMYNWNIMNRFAHPELIAMTAPRAFCIEFGQHDGITTPEWTATAWGQTKAIRDHMGFTDRIELSHYNGVHEMHGIKTFDFLDRFLRPQRTVGRDYEYDLRSKTPSRHPMLPYLGGRSLSTTPSRRAAGNSSSRPLLDTARRQTTPWHGPQTFT